jgi:hypothetical protein
MVLSLSGSFQQLSGTLAAIIQKDERRQGRYSETTKGIDD